MIPVRYVRAQPTSQLRPSRPGPRTFCVLGVPRGGTTMIAELLIGLGVYLGKASNRSREDRDFLSHRGHRDLFRDPRNAAEKSLYVAAARRIVRERNESHAVWGWKDPIANCYIAEIVGALRNPHFIFVTRDPAAVAQREMIAEGGNWPPTHALAHIHGAAVSLMEICGFLAGGDWPILLVSYERALQAPEEAAAAVQDFVGMGDAAQITGLIHPNADRLRQ